MLHFNHIRPTASFSNAWDIKKYFPRMFDRIRQSHKPILDGESRYEPCLSWNFGRVKIILYRMTMRIIIDNAATKGISNAISKCIHNRAITIMASSLCAALSAVKSASGYAMQIGNTHPCSPRLPTTVHPPTESLGCCDRSA